MFYHEYKLFFRSRSVWAGLILLFIAGVCALYLGRSVLERQKKVIKEASVLQGKITGRDLTYFGKELGLMLYHHKFSVARQPDNWSAFSSGQNDINPFIISTNIRGLEGQLYDADLNNPSTLLLGNLDLAFVYIYLFPLVVIAFCYNLLSAEKESGRWGIVKIQSARLPLTLARKFLVRLSVLFALAFGLLLLAAVYLGLPPDARLAAVSVMLFLYLVFWFALVFLLISANWSSSANAASLIACWVFLNICVPALLNVWLSSRYPVPEALDNVLTQREGYHEKWDMDKSVTMNAFYKHYPQFRKYPFPNELNFSWYWYYAMQQMGDDEAAASTQNMLAKLDARNRFTESVSSVLPGIRLQSFLNGIAGTDLAAHTAFQQFVRKEHENLRLFFYPGIFQDKKPEDIRWDQFRLKDAPVTTDRNNILGAMFPLVLLSVVLFGAGLFNIRKAITY